MEDKLSLLVSKAHILLPDAAGLAARMIDHLAEHNVSFENRDGAMVARLSFGTSTLVVEPEAINVRVEAADLGDLEILRSVIASHIIEFAGDAQPAITWVGHESRGDTQANFRVVRLKATQDLTPHMRRLTFTGDDITRFASERDIHVRLYFPPPGLAEPEWPRPGPDGRILWPAEDRRPTTRYYTIRRIDTSTGEIDIDFVLHDHAGPGAGFAVNAEPGAICGMSGPLGRNALPARWMLLAGDETALPAIARILETLPEETSGHALVEVATPSDRIELQAPRGMSVHWLYRNETAPGPNNLLFDATKSVQWPDHSDVFVWVAGETQVVKNLRQHFREVRNLAREQLLAVAYWGRQRA